MAVITGGKGAIGLATARRLAALGARIVSIDRSEPEKVQALLDALPQVASGPHFALTASITDSAALNAAANELSCSGRCMMMLRVLRTDSLSAKYFARPIWPWLTRAAKSAIPGAILSRLIRTFVTASSDGVRSCK